VTDLLGHFDLSISRVVVSLVIPELSVGWKADVIEGTIRFSALE
jgi:hypothetical protein